MVQAWRRQGQGEEETSPAIHCLYRHEGYEGQVMHKQIAVYGGGDAKNAYWQLKEDRYMDCIESSRLEEAWRLGEHRRPKERLAQEAQVGGHPRRVGGGEQTWKRAGSPTRAPRSRSVESF